jgi:Ni,Fe-hydrogenase I cytochrome b subunit
MKAPKEKIKEPEAVKNPISSLPFSKGNYTVMIIGILLIITGFIIMSLDKEEFGFGFLGLTLGPVITFLGFMVEIYAVLKK